MRVDIGVEFILDNNGKEISAVLNEKQLLLGHNEIFFGGDRDRHDVFDELVLLCKKYSKSTVIQQLIVRTCCLVRNTLNDLESNRKIKGKYIYLDKNTIQICENVLNTSACDDCKCHACLDALMDGTGRLLPHILSEVLFNLNKYFINFDNLAPCGRLNIGTQIVEPGDLVNQQGIIRKIEEILLVPQREVSVVKYFFDPEYMVENDIDLAEAKQAVTAEQKKNFDLLFSMLGAEEEDGFSISSIF